MWRDASLSRRLLTAAGAFIGVALIIATVLIGFVLRRGRAAFRHRWLKALAAALISVGMGYLALVVVDLAFKTDFRFWGG